MNQQLATKTFDEEIRERLRQLVKTRSQSDLARKTNTLVSTVNRYLKSTKIPGEFCTAVINGLGVNPAWLMTGEGTPFLADVSAAKFRIRRVDGLRRDENHRLAAHTRHVAR